MKKLFYAFILSFLFTATSWAECVETIPEFRVGGTSFKDGFNWDDKTKEYTTNLNFPFVSFDYKSSSDVATGVKWRVDEYVNGAWEKHELSESRSGSAQIQLSRFCRS